MTHVPTQNLKVGRPCTSIQVWSNFVIRAIHFFITLVFTLDFVAHTQCNLEVKADIQTLETPLWDCALWLMFTALFVHTVYHELFSCAVQARVCICPNFIITLLVLAHPDLDCKWGLRVVCTALAEWTLLVAASGSGWWRNKSGRRTIVSAQAHLSIQSQQVLTCN